MAPLMLRRDAMILIPNRWRQASGTWELDILKIRAQDEKNSGKTSRGSDQDINSELERNHIDFLAMIHEGQDLRICRTFQEDKV
jgi:hypothetical protein